MPLTGGEADKLGNSYEALWTVRCMLRILQGEARSIYLEPFGAEGAGAEFILTRADGGRDFHQVKRQRTGGWRISTLASEGLLSHFKNHLDADSAARCVFVSQDEPSDLRELWERSLRVDNYNAFEQNYLNAPEHKGNFYSLKKAWGDCPDEKVFALLRRLSVEGSAETTLREDVSYRAHTLVMGEAENVVSAMWQQAFDSIRQTLTAPAIWAYLESPERNFARRVWNADPRLQQRIAEANERYLSRTHALSILGNAIPRVEAQQAWAILQTPRRNNVLISGDAGAGKTGVVAETMELAQGAGWVTLAFRMDELEAVHTARQVGEQLDLPDSPVTVLAGVAGNLPSLLVIDQLDAVSQTSGRHPAFFERVEEMLRQCSRHSNMRVLLACRQFDLQNDDRLRRLVDEKTGVAQAAHVQLLDAQTVDAVVQGCGIAPGRLTDKQRRFLAIPLHLKLFTEVRGPLTFETLKDLYDAYWDKKRNSYRDRFGLFPNWTPLFDRLLERMVSAQTLSVPELTIADDYPDDLSALLTAGVLIRDGKRISFFHETFFDYVFARRFVAQGKRLPAYLQSQEQHLFLRGIVRQVLTHTRSEDFDGYLSDLRELLENQTIRFHLKRLVLQWLRGLSVPAYEEWEVVQALAEQQDADLAQWSETVPNSPAWFTLLDESGWLQKELDSGDEPREKRVVEYLCRIVGGIPHRIGEILLGWTELPAPWPDYAAKVLACADIDKSRYFVDAYLRLQRSGFFLNTEQPFDTHSRTGLFMYDLPEKQPAWAVEVFVNWLIEMIKESEQNGNINPFFDQRNKHGSRLGSMYDRLYTMIEQSSHIFVDHVLPVVLELVRRNAYREGTAPWPDEIWHYFMWNTHYSLHEQLLEGLVRGLRFLAENDPDTCRIHIQTLEQYLDFRTAGWVLARTYTANGEAFAEEASQFLLRGSQWLELGWADSSNWVSRELIEAITLHCSDTTYQELEAYVLAFYPTWERQKPRFLGNAQLALLNGFSPSRRSQALKRRLGELQRKFEVQDDEPPQGVRSGFVGPPFSAQWEKLTDEQWLQAVKKYASEERNGDFFRGGCQQLASELERQVETDPARFARLLCRMPATTNPVYFQHVLSGIGKGERVNPTLVWAALRHCDSLPNRPCGRSISFCLKPYEAEEIPTDILEMISWYATADPDPQEEVWLPAQGRTTYYGGDAASAGLNSVRGGMAWTVSRLLFNRKEHFGFFEPFIERMVCDPSIAVRTQVALALLPLLNVDRDRAVSLFVRLCTPSHTALLKSRFVAEFLSYAQWTHFSEIQPLVEVMLESDDPDAVHMGAQVATLAALTQPEAMPFVERCLLGSEKTREGLAEVVAGRVLLPNERQTCERLLAELFNDTSSKVRHAAANCFRDMQGSEIASHEALIAAFIESKAFPEDNYAFFEALRDATVPLPDIVCSVFEKSTTLMRGVDSTEVVRTGRFADRQFDLVIRLYERTGDHSVKRRCLNIIDAAARLTAVYDLEQTLTNRDL